VSLKRKKDEIRMKKDIKVPAYIRKRVLTDIGQASMCWEEPEKAGVFDTEETIKIGDALCQYIVDKIERGRRNE
jgi:hypothetical protein